MKLIIRIGIAILLFGAILWYLGGVGSVVDVFAAGNPFYLVLALLVMTADRALMSYKWGVLLRSHNITLPFLTGFQIYCSSMVWGLFLPSTVGSDVSRAYLVTRRSIGLKEAVASIVVERMIGFITSLLFGLAALVIFLHSGKLDDRFDRVWIAGGSMLLSGVFVFLLSMSRSIFDFVSDRIPQRVRRNKVFEKMARLHAAYIAYGASKRTLMYFFGLTAVEQALTIVFAWIIALALNVEVGLIFIAGVLSLTLLMARLPISFDGIGVFEGIFVLLMGIVGVPAAEALSIALMGRVIQILSWLPWWFTYSMQTGYFRPPEVGAVDRSS